jgi:hypothetical protein
MLPLLLATRSRIVTFEMLDFSREHKFSIGQTPSIIDDVIVKPDIWVFLL